MKKTFVTTAVMAALALVGAHPAPATEPAPTQDNVERSFNVGRGGTLQIDASFGSIEVSTSGGSSVDVKVIREVRERYEDDAQQILAEHQVNVSQSGNDIIVTTEVSDRAPDRWNDEYRNTPLRVRFEISVPRDYNVDLETAGGNIEVKEVGGTIEATTSGGNVSATITRQPSGDCRLSTSAGTVTVTLAEGIAVDVDARTSIGSVASDFSIDGTVGRNSIRGSINGGGPELHLRTSAGNIRIRRS